MQPTTEILERISKDSLTHKEEVFTRLYRYLLRPDIYYQAYQRLYTNKGASTMAVQHGGICHPGGLCPPQTVN